MDQLSTTVRKCKLSASDTVVISDEEQETHGRALSFNLVDQLSTAVRKCKLSASYTIILLDNEEDTQNIAGSFNLVDEHNVAKTNTSAENQQSDTDTLENSHSIA